MYYDIYNSYFRELSLLRLTNLILCIIFLNSSVFVHTESSIFDILTDAVFLSNQLVDPSTTGTWCGFHLYADFFNSKYDSTTHNSLLAGSRMQNPKKYTGTIDKEIDHKSHMDF